MGIRITDRDTEMLDFIRTVKVADADSLSKIFFNGSLRSCQKRLLMLNDCGYINRFRDNNWEPYVYYTGKKDKQWRHNVYLSKLTAKLKEDGAEILKIKSSTKINNVIVDGIIAVKKDGSIKICMIEIERNYRKETINKYIELYKSGKYADCGFKVFPTLILITDKKNIDTKQLPFKVVIYSFDNID